MLATIGNIIDSVQVYVLGCNMEQEACEVAYNKADEI